MAKQKGIFPLSGNIGGVNFYFLKGEPVARAAGGGFNGKQIRNSPKMVRVRENMSEFGWCSTLKKELRLALLPFYTAHNDPTLHGRMMRLLQEIKTHDTVSARGQRRVGVGMQTEAGRQLFADFAFSPKRRFAELIGAMGRFDADSLGYSVSGFSAASMQFPAAATHTEVLYGVLRFDFDSLDHSLAMAPALLFTADAAPADFVLVPETLPEGEGIRIAFGCVRFYQEVNGNMVALGDLNGFGLGVLGIVDL